MYYFFRGLSLIQTKGLKRFVLIPLSINLVLFSFAFYFLLQQVNAMVAAVQQYLPGWLHWLEYLLIPLGVMTLVIGSCKTPAGRTAGEVIDDATITTKVKAKLLDEDALQGIAISVETFEGEVTLSGRVLPVAAYPAWS